MSELRSAKNSSEEQKNEEKKKKSLGRKFMNLFKDEKCEESKTPTNSKDDKH